MFMPNWRTTTTSHSKLRQCMKVIRSSGNLARTNIYTVRHMSHTNWMTTARGHGWAAICPGLHTLEESLAACKETVRITEQINSYDRRLVENHDPWINAISMRSFTLYSITTANAWLAADWRLCSEFADEILIVIGLKRWLLDQEASFF